MKTTTRKTVVNKLVDFAVELVISTLVVLTMTVAGGACLWLARFALGM